MERTLSQEERLKRAEEIYYRRQNAVRTGGIATVNIKPKKNYKLLKKVIIQIIICAGIYSIIYSMQGKTDNFSIDSIKYLKDTIAYDIDINRAFEETKKYITTFNFISEEEKTEGNNLEQNEVEENVVDENLVVEEATLSASEQAVEETAEVDEEASSISQMEQDAEYIKSNISFIKPLTGPVTSRFGIRNPSTETVPKYHTGIDIGVAEGTVIASAMEGEVELVSSYGDYGNHIKITNGEVTTLYAHCKTIYVSQGDKISQGQEIGETGSTGNVTGPHLHFEIRRNNQYVDPDLILEF